MTAYYVQPDPSAVGGEAYWLEGYAVGDAKFAAAQSDATSASLVAPSRVKETGLLSEGDVTSLFGGNRVVAAGISQSPASATLTGIARVRQSGWLSSATSTTLIASSRVKLSQAISRAQYADSEYWNYGYDYDGDAGIVTISATAIYNSNGVLSAATSATDIGSTRKLQSGYLSQAQVAAFAGSLRIRDGIGIRSDATGTFLVPQTTRIVNVAYLTQGQSIALASLSEKWIDQAEDADIWTDIIPNYVEDGYWVLGYTISDGATYGETWADIDEPEDDWSDISIAASTWAAVTTSGSAWTDLSPLT